MANAKGVNDAMWGTKNNQLPVIEKAMTGVKLHAVQKSEPKPGEINLSDRTNIVVAPTATVNVLTSKTAGSQADIAGQIKDILDADEAGAANVSASFKNMNFDLTATPDKLDYEDLMISEPKYLVSIGEILPKKPQYVK